MGDSKRPSTSSLRRFITSRPYVTIAEIRRRFALDAEEAMACIALNGTSGYVGLPEREALKLEELWARGEIGLEFSAEVRAPVVVGVYPMRIARFVVDPVHRGANGEQAAPAASEAPGARERSDAPNRLARQPGASAAPSVQWTAPGVGAGPASGAGAPVGRSARRRLGRRSRR